LGVRFNFVLLKWYFLGSLGTQIFTQTPLKAKTKCQTHIQKHLNTAEFNPTNFKFEKRRNSTATQNAPQKKLTT
jgi:hypothetical protein